MLVQPGNKRAIKWRRPRRADAKAWPVAHWAQLLRAIASDGQIESIREVTVTVNAGGSAQSR